MLTNTRNYITNNVKSLACVCLAAASFVAWQASPALGSEKGKPFQVWRMGNEVLVNVPTEPGTPDKVLKSCAVKIAESINSHESEKPKRFLCMFVNRNTNDNFKSLTLSGDELTTAEADSSVCVLSCEKLTEAEPSSTEKLLAMTPPHAYLIETSTGSSTPASSASVSSSSAAPEAKSSSATSSSDSATVSVPAVSPSAAARAATSPSAASSASGSFKQQREALVDCLNSLQKKKIPTATYSERLAKLDAMQKHGDTNGATKGLANLCDEVLAEDLAPGSSGSHMIKGRISATTAVTPPAGRPRSTTSRPASSARQAALIPTTASISNYGARPQLLAARPVVAPTQRTMIAGDKSIADFKGTEIDLARVVVTSIVERELGPDAPKEGPFLIERLRIGRRIQELDQKKVRVDGYRAYNHDRIEAVVAANDNRRMAELANNIRYLQMQLSLPTLAKASK